MNDWLPHEGRDDDGVSPLAVLFNYASQRCHGMEAFCGLLSLTTIGHLDCGAGVSEGQQLSAICRSFSKVCWPHNTRPIFQSPYLHVSPLRRIFWTFTLRESDHTSGQEATMKHRTTECLHPGVNRLDDLPGYDGTNQSLEVRLPTPHQPFDGGFSHQSPRGRSFVRHCCFDIKRK